MIYHVVAMAQNRVIGKDNKLPWHFPCDLKHFKKLTLGQTVIMGRKTYESIGKPLPGRENFVLTSKSAVSEFPNLNFFSNLDLALAKVKTKDAFIIGGGTLYRETLRIIDGIFLTKIEADYEGDTFYPIIEDRFLEKTRMSLQDQPKIDVIYFEKNTTKCNKIRERFI